MRFDSNQPPHDSGRVNQFYNIEYRKLYGGSNDPSAAFAKQFKRGCRIIDYLVDKKILRKPLNQHFVLEVGCGAGGVLSSFRKNGCCATGVDLGEEYVSYGKSLHGLDLSVGNLSDVKMERPADIIIYSHVLEHILVPKVELGCARRALADEGVIYVEVPGVKHLMYGYEMDMLRFLQNAHTYHFTLRSLRNLMQTSGFRFLEGNEVVYSVFEKADAREASEREQIVSDYEDVVSFLRKLERFRRWLPIAPYRCRQLVSTMWRRTAGRIATN